MIKQSIMMGGNVISTAMVSQEVAESNILEVRANGGEVSGEVGKVVDLGIADGCVIRLDWPVAEIVRDRTSPTYGIENFDSRGRLIEASEGGPNKGVRVCPACEGSGIHYSGRTHIDGVLQWVDPRGRCDTCEGSGEVDFQCKDEHHGGCRGRVEFRFTGGGAYGLGARMMCEAHQDRILRNREEAARNYRY